MIVTTGFIMLDGSYAEDPSPKSATLHNNPFSLPSVVMEEPLADEPVATSELELRAVILAPVPQDSFANISGEIFRVGERRENVTLVEVSSRAARVLLGDKEVRLLMDAQDADDAG